MNDYFPDNPDTRVATARERTVPGASMRPGAFVRAVAEEVLRRLGTTGPQVNSEIRWRLVKFWYGPDESIHYELSLHENTSQLEIGLHAEASAERNRAFYAAFDKCMVEVQRELGTSMWLEEWDRGWMRLYETQPLWPLDASRTTEVAKRIVEVITVLEPIYQAITRRGLK